MANELVEVTARVWCVALAFDGALAGGVNGGETTTIRAHPIRQYRNARSQFARTPSGQEAICVVMTLLRDWGLVEPTDDMHFQHNAVRNRPENKQKEDGPNTKGPVRKRRRAEILPAFCTLHVVRGVVFKAQRKA